MAGKLSCQLDHLVICANSCEQGVDWFEARSGIRLPAGGQHPMMATHNHLTALSSHTFLEIIAINPTAVPQRQPRWFQLDDSDFQQRLQRSPCLSTWVVAVSNLDLALDAVRQAGVDAGEPVALSRGDLHWRLGLRPDGSLACQGLFPILIEWPPAVNPVSAMQDQGVRLERLRLQTPDYALLSTALAAIGADQLVEITEGDTGMTAMLVAGGQSFQI